MRKDLSIVVPAFNEELRVGKTIDQILDFVKKERLNAELIVVDDGSTDNTRMVALEACAKYPSTESKVIRYEKNRGKGYAVKKGLLNCRSNIALFSDADLSTPIEEVYKLTKPIQERACDVAFGSRALNRNLIGVRQPWRREQSGKVFNLIVRTLTGLPFWDTQCGFKAFNMEVFSPLLELMEIERFGFDVEFLFVSNLRGLKLKEVPVRWNHDDNTKVDVFRDSRRMFNEVRQIRRNAKRGRYDQIAGDKVTEFVEAANYR